MSAQCRERGNRINKVFDDIKECDAINTKVRGKIVDLSHTTQAACLKVVITKGLYCPNFCAESGYRGSHLTASCAILDNACAVETPDISFETGSKPLR